MINLIDIGLCSAILCETKLMQFSISILQEIVDQVLTKFNKRLDNKQMDLLLSKEASANPLWLSIACEELRVFGLFSKVTEMIKGLADGLLE